MNYTKDRARALETLKIPGSLESQILDKLSCINYHKE